ncbi:MAG: UDP-N-acetylmuramate dehydrogenase [Paraglaciecola sp.]|jgi:UDP-N-acetylmuramate dehydrogenase
MANRFLLAPRLYSLKHHHSFNLPASCLSYVEINSSEKLHALQLSQLQTPIWLLGEGSNCVFVEDFQGTVARIKTKGIKLTEEPEHFLLAVSAGENWHRLVVWCLQNNIYGFENLALIPGTVGATPIQNIGAYGIEIERFIRTVEYVCLASGETKQLSHSECQFAYRDSIFKNQLRGKVIISKVIFALPRKWQSVRHYGELASLNNPDAQDIFKQVVKIRREKLPDPQIIGNAGSFFKNPVIDKKTFEDLQQKWPSIPNYIAGPEKVKIAAAWLIDSLGFKGKSIGGIRCHPNQALVLTNTGEGTGEQLLELAREIKRKVMAEFGIELENEVQLIASKGLIEL